MTYQELYRKACGILLEAGCREAQADARQLLFYVADLDLSSYALRMNEKVPEDISRRYLETIARRSAREPIQYITGEAPFFGYTFYVTPAVLIPRFDTEILVEEALRYVKPDSHILDLCTGSGCILLTILAESRHRYGDACEVMGTASDISEDALSVAKYNDERLRTEANFILSDLFNNICGTYDIITTNPPYIPTEIVAGLEPEVRDHEPNLALDGKEDGLFFYRKIANEAGAYLREGGRLIMEIGFDQGEAVMQLLDKAGYTDVKCIKDLSGLDRVVMAVWQTYNK